MRRFLFYVRGGPLALVVILVLVLIGLQTALAQTPAPAKPNLLLPPPAFATSSSRPVLQWQAISGVTVYDVQVDNNSDYRSLEQNARVVAGTNFTTASLPNGTYFWRVRSVAANGTLGSWSESRRFTVNTSLPQEPEWMGEQYVFTPHYGVPAGQPTGQVVINEVCTEICDGANDTIELFNAGTTPVNITNWRLTTYITSSATNVLEVDFYLPAYVLAPGAYVSIIEGGAPPAPDADKIYLGPNVNISYVGGSAGAVMLRSTAPTGIDFVRFRGTSITSTVAPPAGTTWLAPDAYSNVLGNNSFGRDLYSLDTNKGSDWSQPQPDTINAQNTPPTPTAAPTVAPIQVLPAANAIFNGNGFVFRWNAVPNATQYRLEIYAGLACIGVPMIANGYPTLQVSAAGFNAVYYWRVRGENFIGNGPWSTCRKFTGDNTPPALAPALVSPTDMSNVSTPKPLLKWGSVPDAARYEVALEYGDGGSPETIATVVGTSFTVVNPLQPSFFLSSWHYWRVRALDAAGNPGPWSAIWRFDVSSASGVAPTLNYFQTASVMLTWMPVSWANGYQMEVDDTSTFASPEYVAYDIPRTAQQWAIDPLPRDGLYNWRIRARRDDGTWGAWSKVQTFFVRFP